MTKLYYVAPSDECFEDMRQAAVKVWFEIATNMQYFEEKAGRLQRGEIHNIRDNFMYILASFSEDNARRVVSLLKPETVREVRARLESGGNGEEQIQNILGY